MAGISSVKCEYDCGFPGTARDEHPRVISGVHYETQILPPGIIMVEEVGAGVSEIHKKLPATAGEIFSGVVRYDATCVPECHVTNVVVTAAAVALESADLTAPLMVPPRRAFGLIQGDVVNILVEGDAAIDKGSDVYVRIAAGTNSVTGAVRGDDDGGTALLLEGAYFMESADAAKCWAPVNLRNASRLA